MHPAIIKNMNFNLYSEPQRPGYTYRTINLDIIKIVMIIAAVVVIYNIGLGISDFFGKSKDTLKAENVALVEKVEQVVQVNHDNAVTQEVKQEAVVKAEEVFVKKEKASKEVQKKIEKVTDTFVKKADDVKTAPELTFEEKEAQLSQALINALWAGHELMKGDLP